MNRPLVVLSEDRDGLVHRVYANREGLLKLRDMIDRVLAGQKVAAETFYAHSNWFTVEIHKSSHADFPAHDGTCRCGCQDKYAEEEAKYHKSEQSS